MVVPARTQMQRPSARHASRHNLQGSGLRVGCRGLDMALRVWDLGLRDEG